jgi:site-specific DNA-methyltransferase (adenine-specific)
MRRRHGHSHLIHDGSDEVISLFPAKAGAFAPVKRGQNGNSRGIYGDFSEKGDDGDSFYNDSGSAARFFYVAKASATDREEGCEGLELRQRDHSRKEGNPGGDNPRNRGVNLKLNNHPTVKPTELMRYLCRLITPPGGIVLDPFMGSGSTGKGAVLEGFSFIGIEKDEEYLEIARARIGFAKKLYDEQHIQKSLDVFG